MSRTSLVKNFDSVGVEIC